MSSIPMSSRGFRILFSIGFLQAIVGFSSYQLSQRSGISSQLTLLQKPLSRATSSYHKYPIFNGARSTTSMAPLLQTRAQHDDVKHISLPSVHDMTLWVSRALAMLVSALYSTNYSTTKIIQESFPTSTGAALRFAVAAIALAPLLAKMRREAILPGLEIGGWVALGYITQGIGLETSTAGKAAFLCSLSVLVCPLLAELDARRAAAHVNASGGRRATLEAAAAGDPEAVADVVIITEPPPPVGLWPSVVLAIMAVATLELGGETAPGLGDLWLLIQPVGFGFGFYRTEIALRTMPDQAGPLTAIQGIVVAVCSAAWAAMDSHGSTGGGWLASVAAGIQNPLMIWAILWSSLVATALCTMLEKQALKHVSSADTALIYTTEPVWAALFGWIALGEHVGPPVAVGGALIIAACLARVIKRPHRPILPLHLKPASGGPPAAVRCRVVRPPGRIVRPGVPPLQSPSPAAAAAIRRAVRHGIARRTSPSRPAAKEEEELDLPVR